MKILTLREQKKREYVVSEIRVMRRIHHANIVNLIDCFLSPDRKFLMVSQSVILIHYCEQCNQSTYYSCMLSGAILRCSWFLRLEEEYSFSLGFYDSKRSIGFLSVFIITTRRGVLVFTARRGVLVFSRSFFTGNRFVHAAFWPKSKSEKSCLDKQIFAKRQTFFDHALRLMNYFLTFKSSFWLNGTYR